MLRYYRLELWTQIASFSDFADRILLLEIEPSMDWIPGGQSEDLEDRRGEGGGGGFGLGHGLGIGGFLIVLVLSLLFHRNFFALLGNGSGGAAATTSARPVADPSEDREVQFVSFVLDDTQKTWTQILSARGVAYPHAKLVLFRDGIQSGCGMAQSSTGPFYCPGDEKVYIDLSFFDELKQRFGAPGEFAQAYVIAHELGHHVQDILGIERSVSSSIQRGGAEGNALSQRLELQADCFAGVWAHTTEDRNMLGAQDVQEAMNAAAAVGDDRLQRMAGRHASPESFTHGTSEQRMHWFQQGFTTGDLDKCNTFQQ